MRKRLYQILEIAKEKDKLSHMYDIFMIVCITLSLIPLAAKDTVLFLTWMERCTTLIFLFDYVLKCSLG